MGVCQKTVSNAVTEFIEALNHPLIVKKFIKCNLGDERFCRSQAAGFARRGLLPNIVGAMDGTYVRILKPPHSGSQYYCRKPFCALNVLAVVDARGRFTYVNANFPGSVHDSTVYSLSKLREAFEEGRVPRGFCLLGDSGFTNGSDILTPIRSPRTRQQRRESRTSSRKQRFIYNERIMKRRTVPVKKLKNMKKGNVTKKDANLRPPLTYRSLLPSSGYNAPEK
ncbi:hypothetical protein ANCCAN_24976, partial [Ancylostoma caninum]